MLYKIYISIKKKIKNCNIYFYPQKYVSWFPQKYIVAQLDNIYNNPSEG